MLNDPLANVLSNILNAEKSGKQVCIAKPFSNIIKKVLDIMNREGYIGKYEIIKSIRGDIISINLIGKINNCRAVKPHFSANKDEIEKFEKRFLPAQGFGFLIISTTKGLLTNEEAKAKSIGGKILCFVY